MKCRSSYCSVEHLFCDDKAIHSQICCYLEQLIELDEEPAHIKQTTEHQKKVLNIQLMCMRLSLAAVEKCLLKEQFKEAICAAERAYRQCVQFYGQGDVRSVQIQVMIARAQMFLTFKRKNALRQRMTQQSTTDQ